MREDLRYRISASRACQLDARPVLYEVVPLRVHTLLVGSCLEGLLLWTI